MFHLVSYWWFRRTQYIPECWTPVNPGLFESPKAFMSFPEITSVIDAIDSVTESLYLQLLALIPAGGIGSTSFKNCEMSETDMFERSVELNSSDESTTT